MNTEIVTIEYLKYEVMVSMTADEADEKGLHNIARMMRSNKISRQLHIRRPNGKKFYFSNEFTLTHGITYSKPFSI